MKYQELEVKNAINKLKRKIPYGYDLNIYRGCEHGCKYCFAIYSHDYLGEGNFFGTVYYKNKQNLLKALEKELSSKSWKREIVNIGGVTDSYQPIEREMQTMREVLKLMIKYKTPIIISTKSDLILRDIDLIEELSKVAFVNIAFTITSMDEQIRKFIEPNGSPSIDRFKALKEFKKINCITGVHLMPIIPYLTDNKENIEELLKNAKEVGVDYVLPGTMYLRGKTRPFFLESLKNFDLQTYQKVYDLYKKGSAGIEYKDKFYKEFNEIKTKYSINTSYIKPMKDKLKEFAIEEDKQTTLNI